MQKTRLLTFLIGVALVTGLDACQDHRAPSITPGSTATRLRVRSLSQDLLNNAVKITTFRYDAQGRLSSLVAYQSPDSTTAQVERSTYQYDAQNRLILHQRQVTTRPGAVFGPVSDQNRFIYNAAGKVSEIRYSSSILLRTSPSLTVVDLAVLNSNNALVYVANPRYNAANQLIGSTTVNYFDGSLGGLTFDNEFSFTGDNLTFVTTTSTSRPPVGPPFINRQQNSLTYDNRVNPFYGVYVIPNYFGGISTVFPNLNTLSPSNITSIGGVTYRYEYNSANLPTVRFTVTDKVAETLRFEYEAY